MNEGKRKGSLLDPTTPAKRIKIISEQIPESGAAIEQVHGSAPDTSESKVYSKLAARHTCKPQVSVKLCAARPHAALRRLSTGMLVTGSRGVQQASMACAQSESIEEHGVMHLGRAFVPICSDCVNISCNTCMMYITNGIQVAMEGLAPRYL